jgi:PhoH-like ATPase
MTCIEELDKFKKDKSELGANARSFSRNIDLLRLEGDLVSGIKFKTEDDEIVHCVSVFLWETIAHKAQNYLQSDFTSMDDRILACALFLSQDNNNVVFITNDTNLRIRADIYGLKSEEYKHGRIKHNELYSGVVEVQTTPEIIDMIYKNKSVSLSIIDNVEDPYPNECYIFKSDQQSALCIYNYKDNLFKLIHQDLKTSGILPKNVEQQFALELLRDHKIPLISMVGSAGVGKTILCIAAAIRAVLEFRDYDKIMLLKPVVAMDNVNQLGFAPGTINEKLAPWMASYADNINVIMKAYFKQDEDNEPSKKTRNSKSTKQLVDDKSKAKLNPVQELMELGMLEFGSLEHMRGRSIQKTIVIIDELQNMTQSFCKSLLTRVGEGSKIICCGDIHQIDSPYLDEYSNGLSILVEALKHSDLTAHITLTKTERSKLAELIAETL